MHQYGLVPGHERLHQVPKEVETRTTATRAITLETTTHAREASHLLSITIMYRPSTSLPESIRAMLRQSFDLGSVPRVPVCTQSFSHHLIYDTSRPSSPPTAHTSSTSLEKDDHVPDRTHYSPMPDIGHECWLVLHYDHRFLGRVLRVAQYQQTQVLLLVEHVRSPAILSVAVPYEHWQGRDKTRSLRRLLSPLRLKQRSRKLPDSGHALPGKLPDIMC